MTLKPHVLAVKINFWRSISGHWRDVEQVMTRSFSKTDRKMARVRAALLLLSVAIAGWLSTGTDAAAIPSDDTPLVGAYYFSWSPKPTILGFRNWRDPRTH